MITANSILPYMQPRKSGFISCLYVSSTALLALAIAEPAVAGDMETVMARLEKLEADNKRFASENVNLKERLHRLEGDRPVNARSAVAADDTRLKSSSRNKVKVSPVVGGAMPVITQIDNGVANTGGNAKWAGFYGGLNVGYGWGAMDTATTSTTPLSDTFGVLYPANTYTWTPTSPTVFGTTAMANSGSTSLNKSGLLGGLQVGYNYLLPSNLLAGFEADIQGVSINGSGRFNGAANQSGSGTLSGPYTSPQDFTFAQSYLGSSSISAGLNWLGTARGRLGWLPLADLLLYGTGGLAYGNAYASTTNGFIGVGSQSTSGNTFPMYSNSIGGNGNYAGNRVGYAAGGGIEWMFASNWSLKTEALYYDLGKAIFNSSPMGELGISNNLPSTQIRYDGIIARAGVNYHFNTASSSVVAKF